MSTGKIHMGKSPWSEPPKGYITLQDFAKLLGIHRRTAYNIIKRDVLPVKRENNRYFFEKKAANEFKKVYCR